MSTGADCRFIERAPRAWHYKLQRWPYGEWPEYDEFGPFPTEEAALKHLHFNHANPGGYSTTPYLRRWHGQMNGDPRNPDERWGYWHYVTEGKKTWRFATEAGAEQFLARRRKKVYGE